MLAQELNLNFPSNDPVWCEARFVGIIGGWRSGKTTRGAFRVLCKALDPRVKLIWMVGPDYIQATEEFRMVMEWLLYLGLVDEDSIKFPAEGSRVLTTKMGCRIETKSAKHPERLASVAPDMILLCEPGQMSSMVYDMCRGRLAQKRGDMWLVGTLEDDVAKPRWVWYERLMSSWLDNAPTEQERSFCLPTWTNTTVFPGGINDPELVAIRSVTSDYTWSRRYGGRPIGVENPVFPMLYENSALDELYAVPDENTVFSHGNGAIGVDYGRTFEHPSAIVVVTVDNYERYWVRAAWAMVKADPNDIASVVKSFQDMYEVYQGCVDPNQGFMGDLLGYDVAAGGASAGGRPTEMRFSLANGLLETGALMFDASGPNVMQVWESMLRCARVADTRGELRYNRPLGDDLAQALMYAIEKLRGGVLDPLFGSDYLGGAKLSWDFEPPMEGRV